MTLSQIHGGPEVAAYGAQFYNGDPTALQSIEQMSQHSPFAGETVKGIVVGSGLAGHRYSDNDIGESGRRAARV